MNLNLFEKKLCFGIDYLDFLLNKTESQNSLNTQPSTMTS